jgi:hypothetical protein
VRTGGLGVSMGSMGLREVKGVEAPGASGPEFMGVTAPQASPSNVRSEGVELGAGDTGG